MGRRGAAIVVTAGLMIGAAAASSLSAVGDKDAQSEVDVPVVPAAIRPSEDAVFVPIDPVRAYDSRIAGFPSPGSLPRLTSRVVSVKDGRSAGGVITQPDVVPPGASAVAYNVTVAGATGPNYLAVTPGDASSFTASAINFSGQTDIANAGVVKVDQQRQIKVWNGDQSGATHFIVDITGYYIVRHMWAKVDADPGSATLLHGHGATAAGWIATGIFSVTFERPVVGCGWLATRNDNLDGVSSAGEVSIELGSAVDPNTLWVRTHSSSGTLADPPDSDGFTVVVDC